ncbi:2-isopropylmalate synthase [Microaerobacter geothermalis]|uniref:2-isopropylmalate synthase n=1 Tax=Microaerobacter geothermalis TaxID=674972 RepID=UPI001F3CCD64|nr:2-isopropylmalate synthase [Microaerobacter geothermalis]MCF6093002.1 2-isopropylmalate synthase [Microaerobacter geothermalis]
MRKIKIFDTTLRDGEQSPGVNLSTNEKVEIALQLERLGVDLIEAGFAASSPGDFQSVQAVANKIKNCTVVSLSRSVEKDIDRAWEALKGAENPCIHVFLATSPIHRQYKLRMSKEEVLRQAEAAVRYAKKYMSEIEFSPEDAGRTEIDFLCEVTERVIKAGATRLNIPDTVGYKTPTEFADIFVQLRQRVPGIETIDLSAHCHDDLGLAVANSLAAIQAGVTVIEGTINGIGERAGNAAIEEVALALETRKDFYQATTGLNLKEIARTSRLVSRLTGMIVPGNKAVVGANAFAHESGIHQDGVLKEQTTYEIIRPETVGFSSNKLVLGKHSGRHAFKDKLVELGYDLTVEQVDKLFVKFKDLADRKKNVTDEDIMALVEERLVDVPTTYSLDYVQVSYGSLSVPTATVKVSYLGREAKEEAATGNGSVDSIYKAIERATQESVELLDYKIASVTDGTDALGEVYVRLRQNGITVQGRGVSTDVLEASAKAYIDAINKIVARRGDIKDELEITGNISISAG